MHCQELFLLIHDGLGPEPAIRSVRAVGEAASAGPSRTWSLQGAVSRSRALGPCLAVMEKLANNLR